MPKRDGTGPRGMGPMTGRGAGRCQNINRRNSFWGTMITAIAGTVIKDLTSENSKIKKLVRKVISPKQIEDKQNEKKVINAEYEVMTNENNIEQKSNNKNEDLKK